MDPVSFREALERLPAIPVGLVLEVFGLHENILALPFQDAGVETVEEVAVAPFSSKTLWTFYLMNDYFEGNVGQWFDLQDLLF